MYAITWYNHNTKTLYTRFYSWSRGRNVGRKNSYGHKIVSCVKYYPSLKKYCDSYRVF